MLASIEQGYFDSGLQRASSAPGPSGGRVADQVAHGYQRQVWTGDSGRRAGNRRRASRRRTSLVTSYPQPMPIRLALLNPLIKHL